MPGHQLLFISLISLAANGQVPVPKADPGVTIKDTAYALPAGALFVATTGNDAKPGTAAEPLQTITAAVGKAGTGATIVIRGGTYRESIGQVLGKNITLQPYPHEQVWIKGSDIVTGWVTDGAGWRKDQWTVKLASTTDVNTIDPAYPMAKYPDQVFVDGKPLRQVATRAEVVPGAFFVDQAGSKLYIGDNPGGHMVEASVRPLALSLQFGSGASMVRGLGFVHFAPNYSSAQGGAIISNVAGNTFENNTFAYNSNRGLVVYGANSVIRGNSFLYNGEGGFGGFRAHGSVIEGNYIGHNNTEHFALGWDANGAKFASTHDLLWKNNLVEYNVGGGLWCDSDCDNNIFVGNTVRYNSKWNGIIIEIATSSGGIIAGNLVYGNEGTGISMSGSGNMKIYNNTTAMNGSDIAVSGCAVGNVVKNNIMSGNSTTLYNASGGLFFLNCPTYVAGQALLAASDYNAYYRSSTAAPHQTLIYWGKAGINNLGAFQQATALDMHSISIDNNPVNPFFKDELNGDYSLKPGSVARGKGAPLPQDVAGAIGVAAGVPVDIGAFQTPLDMAALLMPPRAPTGLAFR